MKGRKNGKIGKITRTLRYGGTSALMIIILTAILITVNVIASITEKNKGLRIDCSFNGVTTQSETTLDVLKALEYPVHIYALFSKGNEDAPLMELLDRYDAASDLVSWERTDPALNPTILTRFSGGNKEISSDSLIVYCENTGRWRVLDPSEFVTLSFDYEAGVYNVAGLTYESRITSAISYVVQDTIPRAVIVQGHGELDGETLASLDELLISNNFDTEYSTLSADGTELDAENDVLVFMSPMRDLNEDELKRVTDFTANGGSILFTCDYSDPIDRMPNYEALLHSYGFVPQTGIVVASKDEPATFYNNIRIDLIPEMCATDVTLNLVNSGADKLLLAGARAFGAPEEGDRNLIVSEVLRSSENAYLKVITSESTNIERTDNDSSGPFSLALQARRITTAGYVSRAFIIGCSTAITESQLQTMTDSQEFTIRVMEFLSGRKQVDNNIIAKLALRPSLSTDSLLPGTILLTALPLLVGLAALIVLYPRKNL